MLPKEKIIEESIKLFATKGFDATSVREIASNSNVNIAMISYYFQSKQGILVDIINELHYKQQKMQEDVMLLDITPLNKLKRILEQTIEFTVDEYNALKVLSMELRMNHRSEVVEKMRNLNQVVNNSVKKLIKEINPTIANEKADFIAIALMSTIFEIIIHPSIVPAWKNKISFVELGNPKNKIKVKEYLRINISSLITDILK